LKKNKDILFTNIYGFDFFPPIPATKVVAEWYKNTDSYTTGEKKVINTYANNTIKKCIPIFDAMTAGYILTTQVDIWVNQENGEAIYSWKSQDSIEFHSVEQASLHPKANGLLIPKFKNPYAIKTPKGYSSLFIPPMHNPNGIFTIFEGLVDTDKYFAPVNFPFTLNDKNFEGLIPAGTPMAQVIPIKRDNWKIKIGSDKDINPIRKIVSKLDTMWFLSYKKQFWERKNYT
jgi:hypothetical protein